MSATAYGALNNDDDFTQLIMSSVHINGDLHLDVISHKPQYYSVLDLLCRNFRNARQREHSDSAKEV